SLRNQGNEKPSPSLTTKPAELAGCLTCLRTGSERIRRRPRQLATTGDSPASVRPRRKGGDEVTAAIFRLDFRGRHRAVSRRHRGGGGPVLAFLQGLAGLFSTAGLRAAGDDPGARQRWRAGRRIRPRAPALS